MITVLHRQIFERKMSKKLGISPYESTVVSFRLENEILDFYRREANKKGVSQSEYIRRLLTEGFISESIDSRILQLEESMEEQMAFFEERIKKMTEKGLISDRLLLSFAVLETLAIDNHIAVHGANSPKTFQQAKDKAIKLVSELKDKK